LEKKSRKKKKKRNYHFVPLVLGHQVHDLELILKSLPEPHFHSQEQELSLILLQQTLMI